jgi:hypothetical protein
MKMFNTLLLFLFSVVSYGGTIDPNTPDAKYTKYAEGFKCIGMLCGEYESGDLFCASAVAIDDYHILTAAHVVEKAKFCMVTLGDNSHCLEKIIIHKNFEAVNYGVSDIAICYSKTPFKLKFYPSLYDSNDEESKLCSISGYGFTGTFVSGAIKHDLLQRAGSNFIDKIEKDLLICTPSKRTDKLYTSLEFLIASGDSGGGLFIDGKLAGINSCIIAINKSPSSKYGEEGGHTRVSKFIDWINENKTRQP